MTLAIEVQPSLTRIRVEALLMACMNMALAINGIARPAETKRTENIQPTSSEAVQAAIPMYGRQLMGWRPARDQGHPQRDRPCASLDWPSR